MEPVATDKRRYIMTTYIYKGKEINHTSFISILHSAGIPGDGEVIAWMSILNVNI